MLKQIGVYKDSNYVVRNIIDDDNRVLFTIQVPSSLEEQGYDTVLKREQIIKITPAFDLHGEDPYVAYHRLFTESQEQKRQQKIDKIQEAIATETYDTEGHDTLWEASRHILSGPYAQHRDVIDCWGRLMQAEIKRTPDNRLTRKIFYSTFADMIAYNEPILSDNVIFETLAVTWKHGLRFARYAGLPVEEIEEVRNAKKDTLIPQKVSSQKMPTNSNQHNTEHVIA